MAVAPETGAGALNQWAPFRGYVLDGAYDEMFDRAGQARPPYAPLFERLAQVDPAELRQRQSAADLAFLNQGITFTVYGQKDGTERIFPYDLLPRILTADRVGGDRARAHAAHHGAQPVLKDIYGEARVLREGHRPARPDLQLPPLPPGDDRSGGAP